MNENGMYYIVVGEWLYPNESGREIYYDCDTLEEALECSKKITECEKSAFFECCKTDPTPVNAVTENGIYTVGHIITCKNGLDNWWFMAKIIKVEYGTGIKR